MGDLHRRYRLDRPVKVVALTRQRDPRDDKIQIRHVGVVGDGHCGQPLYLGTAYHL